MGESQEANSKMIALKDVIGQRPATSVDDVIQIMTDIDQLLPSSDGVKWFNYLYLAVTKAVRDSIASGTFNDAQWLSQLDVVFANLYFDALGTAQVDVSAAPSAWRPLFAARKDKGIAKIQFALAGMNAHINRDLPVAIVQTYQNTGGSPSRGDPHHVDYERVNDVLDGVERQVRKDFDTGIIGVIDAAAGPVDDVIAMWSVRAARDAAWTHAELLWNLRGLPTLRDDFFATLDNFTGFAARGLLAHGAGR
jgi:hypothetical protein